MLLRGLIALLAIGGVSNAMDSSSHGYDPSGVTAIVRASQVPIGTTQNVRNRFRRFRVLSSPT